MPTMHELMTSDACVCGHSLADHEYGKSNDSGGEKRYHNGECSLCGCQGYG